MIPSSFPAPAGAYEHIGSWLETEPVFSPLSIAEVRLPSARKIA